MSSRYNRMKRRKKFKKSRKKIVLLLVFIIALGIILTINIDISQLLINQIIPSNVMFLQNYNNDNEDIQGNFQAISTTDLVTISQDIISNFDISQIRQDILIGIDDNIFNLEQIDSQGTDWIRNTVEPFALNFDYSEIYDLRNPATLLNRFFVLNSNTGIVEEYLDIDYFLYANLNIEIDNYNPQVLIFHTHAMSEFFADSPNTYNMYYGIVGVGATLANILRNVYGINVIHYKGVYDMVDGVVERLGAYERIEPSIEAILEQYPSIQLVLDLHRDGINSPRENFVTYINGQPHARIMFVNGLSSINLGGVTNRLYHLPNPYIRTNLAMSFNMQMAMNERFPGLSRRTFLAAFRYINHLRPLSALVEVGMQYNYMQDVHNAMHPLAYIIYSVLFSD